MHSEEYWNLSRAKHALKVWSESDVLAAIGMNQKNICNKMRNKARAIKKSLYIGGNLTRDCFLDLMNDPDFEVRKWTATLKVPGVLNSGWNFYIEGYHLYYKQYA